MILQGGFGQEHLNYQMGIENEDAGFIEFIWGFSRYQ